jgi:hypothetical protein
MQLRFIHPFGAQVSAVVGAMALVEEERTGMKKKKGQA